MIDLLTRSAQWPKRMTGVRGQIWLACLIFAGLTLIASGVALWNFATARNTVNSIAGDNLPQLQRMDAVVLHFTNLIALAPSISVTTDQKQLDDITQQQQLWSRELESALKTLKQQSALDPNLLLTLSQTSEKLIVNLDMLLATRKTQLALQQQTRNQVGATARWVDALRIALTPLAAALSQTPERRLQLYAVQELKSEIHLLYGLMTRIANAETTAELQLLSREASDALARMDYRLQEIPSGSARDVLQRGRDGLKAIAQGDDNIESLQQKRLDSDEMAAQLQRSHRGITDSLNRSLDQLNAIATGEVSMTADSVDDVFNNMRAMLALLAVVALLVSIIGAALFAGPLLGGRVVNLAKTVEQFADGKWDAEIEDRKKDEIGRLADALRSLRNLAMERQRIEERLSQLANFDALTGLPNRSALLSTADSWVARAQRSSSRFALLFIDLDRFKQVNDTQGHEVGDSLLRTTATRLNQLLRRTDIVARLGGDEFVILAELQRDNSDAETVAQKIISEVCVPIVSENRSYFLGASIGISVFPQDGQTFAELLRKADTAMYMAKENGGNSLAFYRDEMNLQATRRIELEADLRRAVDSNHLELWYQPKADLRSGRLAGAEALLRWRHPNKGLISPIDFIPLAEETGLIDEIGKWVVVRAAEDCKRWRDQFHLDISVAVNLSPRQLLQAKPLAQFIQRTLRDIDLSPTAIELEVTESVLMKNLHDAVNALRELQSIGHRIAVDDFGTGYSSLSYIKNLPIDVIKIDKAFVRGLPKDRGDAAVAGAIVGIARALNLTVVAEGVETNEQLQFLRERKCHLVQGYLLSKPLPVAEFEAFVNKVQYGGLLEDDLNANALL